MARTDSVIISLAPSVRVWAYANGQVHPKFCLTRNCLTFFHGGSQVAVENRSTATTAPEKFWRRRVIRKEQGIPSRERASKRRQRRGETSMGAFEALLELLNVYRQQTGWAPLAVRTTSLVWKVFPRSEVVTALRLMVASSGRDPLQFAPQSGRIGGDTQLASQGISEIQIPRAGRWKSRAFMAYVRAVGEGASLVSAALAKT